MIKYIIIFLFCMLGFHAFGQLKEVSQNSLPPVSTSKEVNVAFNSPAASAKSKAKKMKTSLKLTDKQEKSIYGVFFKYETDSDKVHKSKLTKKEKFAKINILNRERQKEMEKILTKEQYHSYIMSFP